MSRVLDLPGRRGHRCRPPPTSSIPRAARGAAARRARRRSRPVKSNASSAASQATAKAGKVAGRAQAARALPRPGARGPRRRHAGPQGRDGDLPCGRRAPKGQVSVNAENGVVFLRGALDDPAWIERLGSEAEQVDGVKAVRNLLHQTGTPAPSRALREPPRGRSGVARARVPVAGPRREHEEQPRVARGAHLVALVRDRRRRGTRARRAR